MFYSRENESLPCDGASFRVSYVPNGRPEPRGALVRTMIRQWLREDNCVCSHTGACITSIISSMLSFTHKTGLETNVKYLFSCNPSRFRNFGGFLGALLKNFTTRISFPRLQTCHVRIITLESFVYYLHVGCAFWGDLGDFLGNDIS